ncbi:hypothetical protein [Kribbella pratensis]|uniref:DUF4386 family protein n=1 Tax=Kribbella pratensis TaxID=2512112 RepID=A0A4R8CMM3_9ACTN|nr:hypothetical protein [Kribbella pratensis]TDW77331.1 hypothetical protein EV653_2496 [Kribbella pratensis]
MTGLARPTTATEPNYSQSSLARMAGPLAVAAGLLMIVVELAILPIVDVHDHVGTSTNLVYRISGVVYFVAFCLLVLVAVAAYARQAHKAGRFGLVGMIAAVVGTMWLGGDLWFESFYVTYIVDHAPQVLELDPGGMIVIGAISSYLLFAAGWALFGIASLRAGVFPRAISVAIVIGGLLGFQALLPPWGIGLGLAMVWLGVWLIKTPARSQAIA